MMQQPPMMQPPAHMPPILPEIDIFAPQGFEGGGSVPPRRTDIRGQDHMLSYITPDEADILQALGGSGEAGPMGIPAFPPGFGGEESGFGSERAGGAAGGPSGAGGSSGGSSGGNDGDSDADEEGDASQVGDMFDSYGSDADERGDAIAEQAVIDQIISDNDSGDAINQAIQNAMSSSSDRVGAGFVDPANVGNVGTGPTPEVNLTRDTRDPESYAVVNPTGIAAVDNRSTRGPDSGRGVGLLGLDDLLADQFTERGLVTDADPRSNQVVLGGGTDNMNLVNTSPNDLVDIGAAGLGVNPNPNIPDMATGTPDPNVNMLDDFDDTTTTPAKNRPSSIDPLTQDPMTVARAMQDIQPPGVMDLGIMSNIGKALQSLTGAPTQDQINAAYANRSPDLVGVSPGLAIAALGMEKGIPAAGMIGMTPDGKPAAITGDMLADINTRSDSLPAGLSTIGGFFNDMTLNDASASKVAVIDPDKNTRYDTQGSIAGAIDGYGRYTGDPNLDPNRPPEGFGGNDGPERPVATVDPCPPGFSLVNGTCTPVSDSGSGDAVAPADPANPYIPSPVIVPSPRQPMPFLGQMPSGYGTPVTGGVNPQVMSEMQKYAQLLSRPQPQYPVGLANGGPVSSNLDMAADNFLKALMPAA